MCPLLGDYLTPRGAYHVLPNAKTLFVLGLGANLGDRLGQLCEAAAAFAKETVAISSVYETPPAGGPAQPDYLNAAILIATEAPPPALLERALEVERSMGRIRDGSVLGPRTIDIDVLWWSGGAWRADGLTLPHPRLHERNFALQPLLDVLPDAVDPEGRRYATIAFAPLTPVATL
jgi:2-amino-4-hydroxy-6-hydroxymethyldihydropteridine diphosphokinase